MFKWELKGLFHIRVIFKEIVLKQNVCNKMLRDCTMHILEYRYLILRNK